MGKRSGKIEVSSSAGLAAFPASALMVGNGDMAEVVDVLAAHGNAVTAGRWRWYHTLARRLRLAWHRICPRERFRDALCAARGHPLSREAAHEDRYWLLRYCPCGKRELEVG